MTAPRSEADSVSRRAALVLSLALPGDALLYLLLPIHAATFGVSLVEAGLLLAANRLVRIAGYGWVARFYERRGPRRACMFGASAAAVAAAGYAFMPGLWGLLPMRLLWGLAFAAMNIATQALVTVESSGAARRSGAAGAIIAAGPMSGLIVGAIAAEFVGPRAVFLGCAAVAAIAIFIAARLPDGQASRVAAGPRFAVPASIDVWSFVQGLTLDGLYVVGLSVLAAEALPEGAALAAGAALSARYLSDILLGPPAGRLAGRVGAARLLLLVSLGSALGLVIIGAGWLWAGCVVVIVLRGILGPLPAPVAASRSTRENRVSSLARLATWRDIGAGVGPLVAGGLLPVLPASLLYGVAALLLAGASLAALRR